MEDIFRERERKYKDKGEIIRDGSRDNDKWDKATTKLLFICKEYYRYQEEHAGDHSESLRKWVSQGARNKPFFKNLLAMALAVHNPEMAAPEKDEDWEIAKECLLSSALINLKKVVGQSYSTEADIRNYTLENSDLLKEQIKRLAPDIIICGGSMRFVSRIYDLGPVNEKKGVWLEKMTSSPYFIDENHPAYWIKDYYEFHGWIKDP